MHEQSMTVLYLEQLHPPSSSSSCPKIQFHPLSKFKMTPILVKGEYYMLPLITKIRSRSLGLTEAISYLISYSCIFIIAFLIPAFLSLNFPIPAFSYPCVLQSLLFFNPRFKQKPILRSSIFLSSMAQLLELRSIILWVLIRWLWNMNWV